MKKISAFSLAETLTTLMLIGVISMLTMPVINTHITSQKRMTMLKKLYSSYSVNIQTVINKDACSSISCLRAYGKQNNNDRLIDIDYNEINLGEHNKIFSNASYFKVSSTCNHCFPEPTGNANFLLNSFGINYNAAVAGGNVTTINNASVYILNDASVAVLHDYVGNCTTTGQVTNNGVDVPICGVLLLDINGEEAPNSPGNDRYAYYISDKPVDNSYLIPVGYSASDAKNTPNNYNKSNYNAAGNISSTVGNGRCTIGTINGYNCTALYMVKNWKMD